MYQIIYKVPPDQKESELSWLREQMIFPAVTEEYDWNTGKSFIKFGMILASDAALTIKLRHKLEVQTFWAVGKKK